MTYDWESDYGVRGNISAGGKLTGGTQASAEGDAVLLDEERKIPYRFIPNPPDTFKYTLAFDATTFATDPTACLSYGDDAVGYTPMVNSSTTLGAADPGSWVEGDPLIDSMFYATIADGTIHHVLNPDNLAETVDGVDVSTEITQEDVMLVIPTLYTKRDANGVVISSDPSEGTAYAHTYDGHTYNYLGIGVYKGTIVDNKLMSVSGATPTGSVTRPDFRAAAQAKGEGNMLTNWHARQLIRDLTLLTSKSFDSQRRIGQGISNASTTPTGATNALGRFAGNVSGTADHVKCLIEDTWALKNEFIDDFVCVDGTISAGQRLLADDVAENMTVVGVLSSAAMSNGWATAIQTSDTGWGIFDNTSGSDSTGLCDYHYYSSGIRLGLTGGHSSNGSNAGVSCLGVDLSLSYSSSLCGARPAIVFD